MLEATPLPTEPQPLPDKRTFRTSRLTWAILVERPFGAGLSESEVTDHFGKELLFQNFVVIKDNNENWWPMILSSDIKGLGDHQIAPSFETESLIQKSY